MKHRPQLKILNEEDLQNKICVIVGTRPGIIMFSPVIRELERRGLDFFIIHSGQHYSYNMDKIFFEDLSLREPRYVLDTVKYCQFHGEQTAEMLKGIEQILFKEKPRIVLVGGDANTNLAGALSARKLHIWVGHIEAGERSYDWRMPEEHNRVMIDHISEYLFVTGNKAKQNLLKEGVRGDIHITGNPIVDAAYQNAQIATVNRKTLEKFRLKPKGYILMTLHREENVDYIDNLSKALDGAGLVSQELGKPVIFLAHPRTRRRMQEFRVEEQADKTGGLQIEEPVGYLDFLNLLSNSALVLTDSGGVQQESCIFHIPCVTLRENTEWIETLEIGINILTGTVPERILEGTKKMMGVTLPNWENPFGDGDSAVKIIDIVEREGLEK